MNKACPEQTHNNEPAKHAHQSTPKVFLLDDDASFLTATARLMRAAGYAVESFSSVAEFFNRMDASVPGCVLLDLQMPGMNGLEVQDAMLRSNNPMPVIFLTGQGDIPATVIAMRKGAEDFLTKRSSKEQLLGAVERALARDRRERRRRSHQEELRKKFDSLSLREREVLGHVLRGKLNKQIAAELGLNERTIKLHRTNITLKLHVQSVAELASLAHEAGLIRNGQLMR